MSQEAELYDGTVLEFPDGTDPSIIQQTAKRMTIQRQSTAKYGGLMGGEKAEIKSAPGFLTNLSQAITAPFNQERAPVAADQPRPGMFGRALESATAVGKGVFGLANAPFETIAPTVTKYAGENLPIEPRHAEAIGNAVGAVAQGSILPWRSRAPLAPARTVEDLITAPRPGLPAPAEPLALPPPAAQPRLNPPEMVTQVTPEGVASQAPKRTIVDLIDEVKQDVKQQVIDEIFQELKSGRPQAAAGAPKQAAPLSIEDLRGQLAPEARATTPAAPEAPAPVSAAEREAVARAEFAKFAKETFGKDARDIYAGPETLAPEAPMFEKTAAGQQAVIPGAEARSIPSAPLRSKRAQTEAPLELEQPALRAQEPELPIAAPVEKIPGTRNVAQRIVNAEDAFTDFAMKEGGLSRAEASTALARYRKDKAIKVDPIGGQFTFTHGDFANRDVLRRAAGLEEAAPAAPRRPVQRLEDSEVAMSTFINRQGGMNIPKNLKEEFGGWNRLHNPKGLGVDVMADEAFNAGLIPEPTTSALIDSLKSGRKSARMAGEAGQAKAMVGGELDRHIKGLQDAPAGVEYGGKEYTAAIPENGGLRLKDSPDKVLKKADDIFKVEEKVPFDIPPEQTSLPSEGRRSVINPSRPYAEGRSPDMLTPRDVKPTPTPASQLAPEEIAAQQEMRGMLGGEKSPEVEKATDSFGNKQFWAKTRKEVEREGIEGVKGLRGERAQVNKLKGSEAYASWRIRSSSNTLKNDIASKQQYYKGLLDVHKERVQEALAEGKPVPAEVLKDYPDLQAKPRTIGDLLKGEKGQIGSTETNPIVTGTRLAMGEAVEQSGKTVRKTMGPEGNDLIDRLTNVRNNTERNTGIQSQPLEDAIKKIDRAHYENFADVLEGKAAPASREVADAVSIADKVRKNIAPRAEAVDLQIKNPLTGEYTPFRPRENYFPHYGKEEFSKIVENPTARADIKAQIKEQLGPNATDQQAERALSAMIKNSKRRDAHLEIARVIDLPDYHKDPRVFLKYINDANRRIAIADQFGPKLEKAEELLTAIGQNHGDKAESFARTLFNRELRMEEVPDTVAHRMMQGARNYEVLTKLGKAFIPNMSQSSYAGIITNIKSGAKGIASAFTKEGNRFARRAGVVNDEVLREFYNEVTGASAGDSLIHKAIAIELKPFTWSEKLNRTAAANAGRYYANETFDALKASPAKTKLRETLSKMGVDVDAALKNGALSSTDELKAAQNIVNRSQFKVDPMELPLFWSSPEGKLLTQFKSFNFKSGQFMKDEILKEVAKGNIGPLVRAATLLPPAGYAVSKIQNALRSGSQDEKKGIADYLATVGVLGIFSDLVRNGGRMDTSTIAGPTLSDVGKGLDAVSQTKQRLSDDYTGNAPAWGPLAKFAARQVPVVGSNLSAMFNEPKSERQQLLDQLGIKDDRDKERRQLLNKLGINR